MESAITTHRSFAILSVALYAIAFSQAAFSQAYTVKPMRMIVSSPPGGVTDTTARAIANEIVPLLGQTVVIDNRGGEACAKANPGKLNFASIGTGSTAHLHGEMLRRETGIDMVHVPYKGSAASLAALLAGDVQLSFGAIVEPMPLIRSGRVRALAILTPQRSPLLPNVPTTRELGYALEAATWFGWIAPAGTPAAIVQRLAQEVQRINSLDDMKRFLADQAAAPGNTGPEAYKELIAADYARYERIVRQTGLRFD